MKIGTLIATIIMLIGAALQLLVSMVIFSGNATVQNFLDSITTSPMVLIALIVMYLGMLLIFITSITTKKAFLVIGSILGILGVLAQALGAFISQWLDNIFFLGGGFILALGSLFYFIGCIQYRAHNKIAIITGLLFFLGVTTHNVLFGYIYPWIILDIGSQYTMAFTAYLITMLGQSALFILHGLVFSFSKKDVYADDGTEDMLSVESGDAFASYVPSSERKKSKKKKKKPKASDDVFDF